MSTATARIWKGAVAGFGVALALELLLVVAVVGHILWLARSQRAMGIGFVAGGLSEFAIVAIIFSVVGAAIGMIVGLVRH